MKIPALPTANLFFQEGTSDKEYHASIQEVNGGYVVNFSYGRRGGTLKEGSKTPDPVGIEEAVEIFSKLVAEKKKKGYEEA